MKILEWFKNFSSSSDNVIYLDLSSDDTEYYIDILNPQMCSSMNGCFCVARNLIEIAETALKEGYNKKVSCKEDLRLIYSLAARIYFLAKYASLSDDDAALDIINVINFLNLPFEKQYEALGIYSEIQPWLAEEYNDFLIKSIMVPSIIQRTLTELLGILADQHTKSLFSKQGRYAYERDPDFGVEKRTRRTFTLHSRSLEKRLKVHVEGERHLAKYVKTLVERMDKFYRNEGLKLNIYSFTPRHPLSEHRHVDKIVREIVLHCTLPPKYIDIKPIQKEANVHHESTSESVPSAAPVVVSETKTEVRLEKEVLSSEEEEKIAEAKLRAFTINEKLKPVVPEGIKYQQVYDSTSFMIALTTPKNASKSLRIYRHLQQKEQAHTEYHQKRR